MKHWGVADAKKSERTRLQKLQAVLAIKGWGILSQQEKRRGEKEESNLFFNVVQIVFQT